MSRSYSFALVLLLAGAGCQRTPDVDKVPVGADVQVTRDDGGLVEGKVAGKTETALTVNTGETTRTVPVDDIADVRLASTSSVDDVPPRATFREVRVPAGAEATVRLVTSASSETSHPEDVVQAETVRPVVVDGAEVVPAGARVRGVVTEAMPSGKVKGRATLALRFDTLTVASRRYPIDARVSRVAQATTSKDAKTIGLPAAGGAIVGAIVGGKKGSAIGAAAAGGAGTAVVLSTPGAPVTLHRGDRVTLHFRAPIDVRVPLR
jgi:hypothetical protein